MLGRTRDGIARPDGSPPVAVFRVAGACAASAPRRGAGHADARGLAAVYERNPQPDPARASSARGRSADRACSRAPETYGGGRGASLSTAASAAACATRWRARARTGCVRVANRAVAWLAHWVPPHAAARPAVTRRQPPASFANAS